MFERGTKYYTCKKTAALRKLRCRLGKDEAGDTIITSYGDIATSSAAKVRFILRQHNILIGVELSIHHHSRKILRMQPSPTREVCLERWIGLFCGQPYVFRKFAYRSLPPCPMNAGRRRHR